MFSRRLKVCIAAGAVLGVLCIVGAQVRSGFEKDAAYLFAFWYNRLLMGIVIGLIPPAFSKSKAIGRGAIMGLLVSFAFYSSINYSDTVGFLAGIVYGMIIEYFAWKYGNDGQYLNLSRKY